VREESVVAIVCQDGYATGWAAHDPHAVPFLLLADLLCLGLDLKAMGGAPMTQAGGEEQR